jgi:hypothetical protein
VHADAGDFVLYTVLVSHTSESTSDAFDFFINSTVHPDLDILDGDGGALNASELIAPDLKTIRFDIERLTLAEGTMSVSFTARVLQRVVPGTVDVVCSSLLRYDSVPGGGFQPELPGREYTRVHVSVPVVIDQPNITLEAFTSSDRGTVEFRPAVHETFTTLSTVVLPEVTSNVVVEVGYVGNPAVRMLDFSYEYGANVRCGNDVPLSSVGADRVVLNFGSCVNAADDVADRKDVMLIYVVMALQDAESNAHGVSLPLETSVAYTFGDRASSTDRFDVVPVVVAEPEIAFIVEVMALDPTDGRDFVRYGITIAHAANSTAPAHDIVVHASVSPLVIMQAVDGGPFTESLQRVGESSVAFFMPSLFVEDFRAFLTIDVLVLDTVFPAAAGVVCTANISYDSHRRDIFSRPGRAYFQEAGSPPLSVAIPVIVATTVSTSNPFTTGNRLSLLEFVTIHVEMILPETESVWNASLRLPKLGEVNVTQWSVAIGERLACAQPFSGNDVRTFDRNTTILLDMGRCANIPDNLRTLGDRLVFDLEFLTLDFASSVAGDVLVLEAELIYTDPSNTSLTRVDSILEYVVVEPDLRLDLDAIVQPFLQHGEQVDFQLRLTPSFGHDVVLTVLVPQHLTVLEIVYAPSSLRARREVITPDGNNTAVVFDFGNVSDSDRISLLVRAIVNPDAPRGVALDAFVNLTYDSSFHPGLGRNYSDFAAFNRLFVVFLSLDASFTDIDDVESLLPNVTIAEQIRLTLAIAIKGPSVLALSIRLPINAENRRPLFELRSAGVDSLGINVEPLPLGRDLFALGEVVAQQDADGVVRMNVGPIRNVVEDTEILKRDDLEVSFVLQVVSDPSVTFSRVSGTFEILATFANLSSEASQNVSVVAPELEHTWNISALEGDAGDLLTLTHVIRHGPNSTWPAFDVLTRANVDPFFELQPVDNFANRSGALSGTVGAFSVGLGFDSAALVTARIELGQVLTLSYPVRLATNVTLSTRINANASMLYRSRPRVTRRDTFSELSRFLITLPIPQVSFLPPVAAAYKPFNNSVQLGERVRSFVALRLTEGLSRGLQVTAQASSGGAAAGVGLEFLEAFVARAGSNLVLQPPVTRFSSSSPDSSLNLGGRRAAVQDGALADGVSLDLGDVLNLPDNLDDENDTLVIELVSRIANADVPNGQPLQLGTFVSSGLLQTEATQDLVFHRPVLDARSSYVDKNDRASGEKQAVMTVDVFHLPSSLVDASAVNVEIDFSGTATFEVRGTADATRRLVLAPGENMTVEHVLVVDVARTTPAHEVCTSVTLTYRSVPISGNETFELLGSSFSCARILFASTSTGFLETSVGQAVVFGGAGIVLFGTRSLDAALCAFQPSPLPPRSPVGPCGVVVVAGVCSREYPSDHPMYAHIRGLACDVLFTCVGALVALLVARRGTKVGDDGKSEGPTDEISAAPTAPHRRGKRGAACWRDCSRTLSATVFVRHWGVCWWPLLRDTYSWRSGVAGLR